MSPCCSDCPVPSSDAEPTRKLCGASIPKVTGAARRVPAVLGTPLLHVLMRSRLHKARRSSHEHSLGDRLSVPSPAFSPYLQSSQDSTSICSSWPSCLLRAPGRSSEHRGRQPWRGICPCLPPTPEPEGVNTLRATVKARCRGQLTCGLSTVPGSS